MYTVRIRRNLSVPIAHSSPDPGIGRTTYLRGRGGWAISKNKNTCTANATLKTKYRWKKSSKCYPLTISCVTLEINSCTSYWPPEKNNAQLKGQFRTDIVFSQFIQGHAKQTII